jgi:hypothetical protein
MREKEAATPPAATFINYYVTSRSEPTPNTLEPKFGNATGSSIITSDNFSWGTSQPNDRLELYGPADAATFTSDFPSPRTLAINGCCHRRKKYCGEFPPYGNIAFNFDNF